MRVLKSVVENKSAANPAKEKPSRVMTAEQQKSNQRKRQEASKNALNKLKIISIFFFGFIFMSIIGTWVAHMILPVKLQWLTSQQITFLNEGMIAMVFSIIVSIVGKMLTK